MNCPHCGQALSSKLCPACQADVLEESLFCHRCGRELARAASAAPASEDESLDFSNRILCSDGTCIGVVDERGICKVCGKPYTGEAQ